MKKVLVADDTKNIRILLKTCLEIEGYNVTLANDGKQAIELMQQDNFDLAFIDIKMPEITGTEVLRRVREAGNNTPVIIMTAYGTIKNAVECTRLGAVTYLQKPFTADKIKALLGELIKNDKSAITPTVNAAAKSISKSLNDDVSSVSVLNKAEELINSCEFSLALDLLKNSMNTMFENPRAYLLLSRAYSGLGNLDKSVKFGRIYETIKQE